MPRETRTQKRTLFIDQGQERFSDLIYVIGRGRKLADDEVEHTGGRLGSGHLRPQWRPELERRRNLRGLKSQAEKS